MSNAIANVYAGWLYQLVKLQHWAKRHPRVSATMITLGIIVLLSTASSVQAVADDGKDSAPPYMYDDDPVKDSKGVPLYSYSKLPLDYSDALHPGRKLPGMIVDFFWGFNIMAVNWVLRFLDWVLTFQWMSWITTPVEGFADIFKTHLTGLGWVSMALALSALVCVLVMWGGRVGAGMIDMGISVMCAILAAGIFANPITYLTSDDGPLEKVQTWGAELANDFIDDDDADTSDDAEEEDEEEGDIISHAVSGSLSSIFVRRASQEISFGHELEGECNDIFTEQMKKNSPVAGGKDKVRKEVGKCDEQAKNYVTNPSFSQVITTLIIMGGSFGIFGIGTVLALIIIATVVITLWEGCRVMWNVFIAILPGVGRYGLWASIAGMFFSAFSILLFLLLTGAFIRFITDALDKLREQGLGITQSMGFASFICIALAGLLIYLFVKRQHAANGLASFLSRFGLGPGGTPKSGIGVFTKTTAAITAFRALSNRRGPRPSPTRSTRAEDQEAPAEAMPTPPQPAARNSSQGGGPTGSGAGTPTPSPSPGGPTVFSSAKNAGKAAAGNTGGVIYSTAKKVKNKTRKDKPATAKGQGSPRIVVGQDGVGHIKPTTDQTVFSSAPIQEHERTLRNKQIRRELLTASQKKSRARGMASSGVRRP